MLCQQEDYEPEFLGLPCGAREAVVQPKFSQKAVQGPGLRVILGAAPMSDSRAGRIGAVRECRPRIPIWCVMTMNLFGGNC